MNSRVELAQLNVAQPVAPTDSPAMAEFMGALDRVNAMAERSDGFIWRLKDDEGNATSFRITELDGWLLNMSVWRDIESLRDYVYRDEHLTFTVRISR